MPNLYDEIPPELPSWACSNSEFGDVVVGIQATCVRNLAGEKFPVSMSEDEFTATAGKIKLAFENVVPYTHKVEIDNLSASERDYMVERWLIDRYVSRHPKSSLLYILDGENQTALINGKDHIKFNFWGTQPTSAIESLRRFRDSVSQYLEWAYHKRWGYLSSDPQISGTGTVLSAICHLPAIIMSHFALDFAKELLKSSVVIQPLWDATPYNAVPLFKISLICRGDEIEYAEKFQKSVDTVINKEREARENIVTHSGELLQDKVLKAQGILAYAKILEHWELISLASTIRLGLSAGVIEGDMEVIDTLLLASGDRNIEAHNGLELDRTALAGARANFAREKLGM